VNYDANQVLLQTTRSEELKKNLSEIFKRNREKQQAFKTEERKHSPVLNSVYNLFGKAKNDS
jgi:hypothetical protein